MTRTKVEILNGLNPHDPASIQALIDFHAKAFGGWVMEDGADGAKPDGDKPDEDAGGQKPDAKPEDKPLGPNGEKALQAERDARKALENQLSQLKSGFAQALGIEAKDAKSSTDDIVATLQQQMAELHRSNLVLSVANTNKITDEGDLELLRDFKGDDAALQKLATRLKPSAEQDTSTAAGTRRGPAPDRSQGRGGSEKLSAREEGLAQARKRFPQPAK